MPGLVHFLRCVGRAAVKNGGKALASLIPFGEVTFEIARDALDEYRKDHNELQLRAELQELAQTPVSKARQFAEEVAVLEAGGEPEPIRLALVSYLDQMPASI